MTIALNVRCDLLVLVQRRRLAVLTLNQEPVLVMLASNVAVSFKKKERGRRKKEEGRRNEE
ncbi:hypothetical protein [Phormidium nigroviride]